MPTTLARLAELVNGVLIGDGNVLIEDARSLSEATAGCISFLDNAKHASAIEGSQATALLVPLDFVPPNKPAIQVEDPLFSFVAVVQHFRGKVANGPRSIDPRAAIDPTCRIGPDALLGPFAVIRANTTIGARCTIHSNVVIGRNCRLGDDVVLHPGVVLYDNTIIGNRVIIHANSVIGADGFGYRFQNGRHEKIPQLGHVEIGDDVEIGACTTIDRGTFEATRIGAGTKIDNLVQVAHNCKVGRHNLLVSQMGIAGSSSTGDYVVVAGQVGIVDHAHIGEGAIIGAKAGVTKDVAAGQRMLGAPATPEREQKRILMSLEKLPEMRRDLKRIKQILGLKEEDAAA